MLLKVKDCPTNNVSIQVSFSSSNIKIKATLLDYEAELCSSTGRGSCFINNVLLYQTEEISPANTKSDKKGQAIAQAVTELS